jgi:hypothetical protein
MCVAGATVRIALRETGREVVDWLHVTQVGSCGHGNEPSGSIKGGEFLHHVSDS